MIIFHGVNVRLFESEVLHGNVTPRQTLDAAAAAAAAAPTSPKVMVGRDAAGAC